MGNISRILLSLIAAGFMASAFAGEGESIVFNPTTGNYLITYLNSTDDTFRKITFIPATKFKLTFKNKFKLIHDGSIHYGYSLASGRDSQQDIRIFLLDPISSVSSSLPDLPLNAPPGKIMDDMANVASSFVTPKSWESSLAYSNNGTAFIAGWSYSLRSGGLSPGSQAEFGFKSRDLPGIILVKARSYAQGSQEIPSGEVDDEDGGFGQQYTELVTKKNFVTRPAAVPTIAVPIPFDAAVLLERIQTQMHSWIGMQLLDATFSSQLDRYFAAAADAYRHNQPKAGKEHIQTLRKMLKKEHDDADKDDEKEDGKYEGKSDDKNKRILIDRLAAKVLDFNLKYVLKRTEEGKDKD